MRISVLLALLCSVAASAGCADRDDAPSTAQCEALREHMIDLRIKASVGGSAAPNIAAKAMVQAKAQTAGDLDQHRRAYRRVLGSNFIDTCRKKRSAESVRCALEASTRSELAACSGKRTAKNASGDKR
jgi:hypothetical protein